MSSTMLLTGTPVTSARRGAAPRKRRFDQRAQRDLRRLLAALREIGDRPNLEQILLRYEVSKARLTAFVGKVEAEALISESCCQ